MRAARKGKMMRDDFLPRHCSHCGEKCQGQCVVTSGSYFQSTACRGVRLKSVRPGGEKEFDSDSEFSCSRVVWSTPELDWQLSHQPNLSRIKGARAPEPG